MKARINGIDVRYTVTGSGPWLALSHSGVRASDSGYGAVVFALVAWQGLHAVLLTLMGGYTLVRTWLGMIDANRRNVFDNTRIMWYYCAAQGLVALLVLNSPRFAG